VFGELGSDPGFAAELAAALELIAAGGVRAAIAASLSRPEPLAA
jgi:hypothetical protein